MLIWIIILCVALVLFGGAIGVFLMRLFFNRKDNIDKALIWIDHSGHYDKFKGFKLNATKDGISYQYKYNGNPEVIIVPNEYGFKFHKGRRMIWANPSNILASQMDVFEDKMKEEEKKDYHDLIKALTISKIGKDAVNAMGGKGGALSIIFIFIILAIGAGVIYFVTQMDKPTQSIPPAQQQQTENVTKGSVTFSEGEVNINE